MGNVGIKGAWRALAVTVSVLMCFPYCFPLVTSTEREKKTSCARTRQSVRKILLLRKLFKPAPIYVTNRIQDGDNKQKNRPSLKRSITVRGSLITRTTQKKGRGERNSKNIRGDFIPLAVAAAYSQRRRAAVRTSRINSQSLINRISSSFFLSFFYWRWGNTRFVAHSALPMRQIVKFLFLDEATAPLVRHEYEITATEKFQFTLFSGFSIPSLEQTTTTNKKSKDKKNESSSLQHWQQTTEE